MWLYSLLRLLSGERPSKATPTQLRWHSATFVFIPIYMVLFTHFGKSHLNTANEVGILFYVMGVLTIAFLILALWVKFVPARISWAVAAIIWIVALWLAFTNRLI